MLSFAADENFNMHIVNGVLRRRPEVDILRVQDAGVGGADDRIVLEWAASEGRVLLTHDANTITAFAYQRIAQGLPMGRSTTCHSSNSHNSQIVNSTRR